MHEGKTFVAYSATQSRWGGGVGQKLCETDKLHKHTHIRTRWHRHTHTQTNAFIIF